LLTFAYHASLTTLVLGGAGLAVAVAISVLA
jgi:hypothetical protein